MSLLKCPTHNRVAEQCLQALQHETAVSSTSLVVQVCLWETKCISTRYCFWKKSYLWSSPAPVVGSESNHLTSHGVTRHGRARRFHVLPFYSPVGGAVDQGQVPPCIDKFLVVRCVIFCLPPCHIFYCRTECLELYCPYTTKGQCMQIFFCCF